MRRAHRGVIAAAVVLLPLLATAVPVTAEAAVAPAALVPAYSSTTGDLVVTISGLPVGGLGKVKVTGPSGYATTVTATRTLRSLKPGTYTLVASSVTTTAGGRHVPATVKRAVTVVKAKSVGASFAYKPGASVSATLKVANVAQSWVFLGGQATLTVTVTNKSKLSTLGSVRLVVPKGVTGLTVPKVTVPSTRAAWTGRATACTTSACSYLIDLKPSTTAASKRLTYGQSVAARIAFTAPATAGTLRLTVAPISGGTFLLDGTAPSVRVVKGVTITDTTPGTPIPTADTTVPVKGSDTVIAAGLGNGAVGPVNVYYEPAPCLGGQTGSCVTATVDGDFSDGANHLYGFGVSPQLLAPASLTVTCSLASCPRAPTVSAVSAGAAHTCALRTDGTVWCWGSNQFGQLGNVLQAGTTTAVTTPVQVVGLPAASRIDSGTAFTCAVAKSGGAVWCWGRGDSGQLGSVLGASAIYTRVPRVVPGTSGVVSLSSGGAHACAVDGTPKVLCWGANHDGQLGSTTGMGTNSVYGPTDAGVTGATAVTAGGFHTCALTAPSGILLCWGADEHGQVGDGSSGTGSATGSPTSINTLEGVSWVDAGADFTCAAMGGNAYCWGNDTQGQIGNPTSDTACLTSDSCALSPAQVMDGNTALAGVQQVSAGGAASGAAHACAVTTTPAVVCWGSSSLGQAGGAGTVVGATTVLLSGTPAQVSAGGAHTCVAMSGGTGPRCWGSNEAGQLGSTAGLGTTNANPYPIPVTGFYDDERLRDFAAYPMAVSMKVGGAYQPFANATMCNDPSLLGSIGAPTGIIATQQAQAAGNCYDVAVSTRDPGTGELTRVVLFAEDPRFSGISR